MASLYNSLKSDPHFFNRESSFYRHLQEVRNHARYNRMIMLTVPLEDQDYYKWSKQDYYDYDEKYNEKYGYDKKEKKMKTYYSDDEDNVNNEIYEN